MEFHGSEGLSAQWSPIVENDKEILTVLFEAYEIGGASGLKDTLSELYPEVKVRSGVTGG